jgi:hypothetical protein
MSLSEYLPRSDEELTFSTCSHTSSDVVKRTDEATPNEEGRHHKRVKTPPTTPLATTKRFPFFDLPRELRDEINHHAFQDVSIRYSVPIEKTKERIAEAEQELVVMATYGQRRQYPRHSECPEWLRYNRQLGQEGLQQFYRQAIFTLSATPDGH